MASLTTCLKKAGDLLDPEDRAEILRMAGELRASGLSSAEAARGAIQARMAEVDRLIAGGAADAPKAGEAQSKEGMTPEQQQAQMVDTLTATRPDMMVMLDGMDKPMPLSEFMAAVRAEADEMLADAPLVELAAQCALVNGP
jgi:hypothetical protein